MVWKLFASSDLLPHGFCYQWKPLLVWLHVISDTLIAAAYFSIPPILIYLVKKKRDLPFDWMFVCFGTFIAACGATHVMEVVTLWLPLYWISGGVKVITALASLSTAALLVRVVPRVLCLPSTQEMRTANEELNRRAATLKKTEERFRQMADNIQEIFWILDPQTKEVSYVSPAFEQICELPLDSLYSNPTSYRELIHPQDRQRVLAELEKLESTNRFDEEFRIVCPSGTVKWVRAIGFTAKDPAGYVRTLVGTAQEITARKQMEVVLRESEDRYRDLVEHSTDLICTYNMQGRLLSINELPARLLGYSREELLNKPMRDFLLPEARAQFDQSLLDIQRDGFVKGLMVVLTKSGERRIWEYHNTLRTDGVAAPIVRGIAHDITDQKRLEKALRLSEEKFAKAFHSSPVEMVITTFQEALFLDVNEAFERNSGFTRDEVIGHTSIELGLWDNPNEREAVIEQIKKHGRLQDREIRFRTKSGATRAKLYSAEQIEIGGKQCLLAVCEDVTERKRAEEALHKTEEQFSAILNHSPNLIFLKDVDGRYLLINEEHRKTFHLTRDQIYGKKDIEIFSPDQAAVFRGSDLQVLQARAPMEFEEVALHDDGPHTSIVQKFPLFDARGEMYAICGFVTDITERKRTEEELRRLSGQLLRLQDEERRKIARDLHDSTGQDLVALATMLGQLRASIPSGEQKPRRLLSECTSLADRCVREVRTLSYVLHPPVLDEAGLEHAIRDYVKGLTQRSGIQVKLEISSLLGRMPRDVELALFRVVQESLTNIHRHSGSQQAKIRIDRNSNLTLEISDSDQGGSASVPRREEEPRFEVGVGIPSMQERVKLIGGRLDIDSGSHGTTVRVTLPLGENTRENTAHSAG
jgi:PAS domain S-box-containing protein